MRSDLVWHTNLNNGAAIACIVAMQISYEISHSATAVIVPVGLHLCINKEKLCHGILSHLEKHNKLHDLSDSNDHFQNTMSISFNSHLKRQQICSICHIKTIFVLDSIDFKSYVSTSAAEFRKYCKRLHVDLYTKHKTFTH